MKNLKISLFLLMLSITLPALAIKPTAGVAYLFSHGIAANKNQAHDYTKSGSFEANHIINDEDHTLETFDYPDAGYGIIYPTIRTWIDLFDLKQHLKKISYRVDRANTDFAGENEIRVLDAHHATIEHPTIVAVGPSRGASALVAWLGTASEPKNNIKALVLESPFDSMDSVLRNIIGEYLYQYPMARSLGHNLIRFVFSQYKKRAITPLQAAADVPKDLPILIVCSEEDTRVPTWSSEKLYQELKDTGHNKAHFVKLKRGFHGKLIQGADGETYRNATHAFYKKYNLPHHPEYAELGKNLI